MDRFTNHSAPMETTRIVFVESASGMGGVQHSTVDCATRLNGAGWESVVACPQAGDLPDTCRQRGLKTHIWGQRQLWSTSIRLGKKFRVPNALAWIWDAYVIAASIVRLQKLLRELKPALVVTKGLSAHFAGGVAARSIRVPCVWHVQDFISERSFGIYRAIFAAAARRLPERIIADGHTIREQLPESLHSRITVIHNGIDADVFRPDLDGATVRQELAIPINHLVIGHAGRITPWKGQHFLIEAFADIARENLNVTLLIVGSPVFDNDLYLRRLCQTVARLGLEKRVVFAGYRNDLPDVLAAMDIFGFTSVEKDTSPLALLSALSSGLPVVAFDIAGVRELIDDETQISLVPLANVSALQRAVSELVADATLRKRLGAAARNLATSRFDLNHCTAQIAKVLSDTLPGSRETRPSRAQTPAVAELRDCA